MSRRPCPRVLIVAENTSRKFGGEAAIPYHLFRLLRLRGAEVRLLTHERNREELSRLFPDDMGRMHFLKNLPIHNLLHRITERLGGRLGAITTRLAGRMISQRHALRAVREMVARYEIDVVHQPTPVSPKELSLLRDVGAPVVFGPLNGGMHWPRGHAPTDGRLMHATVVAVRAVAAGLHLLMPAKRRAALVMVANERTRRALPPMMRARVEQVVENGVDMALWRRAGRAEGTRIDKAGIDGARVQNAPIDDARVHDAPMDGARVGDRRVDDARDGGARVDGARIDGAPLDHAGPGEAGNDNGRGAGSATRLVFMGRLDAWKGVIHLIDAVGSAVRQGADIELEIIGTGQTMSAAEARVAALGLDGRVRFSGWLVQEEAARRLHRSDVFVLPSLFECGGAVVLEAMAAGLPVIATRWGGPADYIDDTCGILVDPTGGPEPFTRRLTDAVLRLHRDAGLRRRMGDAGEAKAAREFDWQRKIDRIIELYDEVVSSRQPRGKDEPSAGSPRLGSSLAAGCLSTLSIAIGLMRRAAVEISAMGC